MKIRAPVWILLALLLSACSEQDNGNPVGSEDTDTTVQPDQTSNETIIPLQAAAVVNGADGIVIDNYVLVSSQRIDRTHFEYTYAAEITNWSDAAVTVSATLISNDPAITVLEGDVDFGDLEHGESRLSTDTFTIRVDRSQPFDDSKMEWNATATLLPPTTLELIDKDLADGIIDNETALLYKVYYDVNDSRLPAKYVGRVYPEFEINARKEARRLFDTLSPGIQTLLAPLLESPDIIANGIPYGSASPAAISVASTAGSGLYHYVEVIPGEVYVGWLDDPNANSHYAAWATSASDEIANTIWPKLTGLFGTPAPGYRVVVRLNPLLQSSQEDTNDCRNIEINLSEDTKAALAHEMTHAILDLDYPGQCNANDTVWLHEATATWAMHFIYPCCENAEHKFASRFLKNPAFPLEFSGDKHDYGAYLWFLYLTQAETDLASSRIMRVPATWAELKNHNNDSLAAINAAVSDLGGLDKAWPEFARYNWNRDPYKFYRTWDKVKSRAHRSSTSGPYTWTLYPQKINLNGKVGTSLDLQHVIAHLGAKYWHFDVSGDPRIRRVRVNHPYSGGSDPAVKVQVLYKVHNKGWVTEEALTDWTNEPSKILCRDKPEEDFEEVLVVITNSEFSNRTHVVSDVGTGNTSIQFSALGCSNWSGWVKLRTTASGGSTTTLNETTDADNVHIEVLEDRFLSQVYRLTGGVVNWHHTGSYQSGAETCSGESFGNYSLANAIEYLEFFGTFAVAGEADNVPRYVMYGSKFFDLTSPDEYLCTGNPTSTGEPVYGSHDNWFNTERPNVPIITFSSPTLYDTDDSGETLGGSNIVIENDAVNPSYDLFTKRREYTWYFQKDGYSSVEVLP